MYSLGAMKREGRSNWAEEQCDLAKNRFAREPSSEVSRTIEARCLSHDPHGDERKAQEHPSSDHGTRE